MRTLAERVEWLRRHAGEPSYARMVDGTGFSRSSLPKLLRDHGGDTSTSSKILSALAHKYGISLDFLALGRGEPFGERGLDTLDRVLGERDWSPAAVAASKAHRNTGVRHGEDDWRRWLIKIEELIEGTPFPPPTNVHPRKSS